MRRSCILVALFLLTLFSVHAHDTVSFTEDQNDTSYYIPYANNAPYMTCYENYTGRILANGYTYTYYPQDHNGCPARPWRLLFRQRCNRPITVYGIAAALATWATGEPDNHSYPSQPCCHTVGHRLGGRDAACGDIQSARQDILRAVAPHHPSHCQPRRMACRWLHGSHTDP